MSKVWDGFKHHKKPVSCFCCSCPFFTSFKNTRMGVMRTHHLPSPRAQSLRSTMSLQTIWKDLTLILRTEAKWSCMESHGIVAFFFSSNRADLDFNHVSSICWHGIFENLYIYISYHVPDFLVKLQFKQKIHWSNPYHASCVEYLLTYIWLICLVNIGKYTIHGCYG